MKKFIDLGKKIYDLRNPREAHRFAVFVARCCLHPQALSRLEKFFGQSDLLKEIAQNYPFVYEQATRAFFYHKSTLEARIHLIEDHFDFFVTHFREDFIRQLYGDKKILLWSMHLDAELGEMKLFLCAESGQRKESLGALMLTLPNGIPIYQILFWIAKDTFIDRDGVWTFWIGAMQGANVDNAKDLVKIVTKKCHAYRTKNLILYAAQTIARSLGIKKIFAVSNEGYYANNHIRRDRKLKTSFSDFWLEVGGTRTSDLRFFELPLMEKRKTFEEIPSHKRAQYRRRFALLDDMENTITNNLSAFRQK